MELEQILDAIRSIKPVYLVEGRRRVWDDLAEMYTTARNDIRIWGEGADLSDSATREDISRLTNQTERILWNNKIITRIQTVDTWPSWLQWQAKLIEKHEATYRLYFTDQQLKFVTQLNIKDDDEVSLVTPEKSEELTYSIKINKSNNDGRRAIQKHLNDFDDLQERSVRIQHPRYLGLFGEVLCRVKHWQTFCFLAHEFHSQRRLGIGQVRKPDYISIQKQFPWDHIHFQEFAWDTLDQRYSACGQCKDTTLASVLSILSSGTQLDADRLAKQIVTQIRPESHVLNAKEAAALLEQDIEAASYRFIEYLSRSLFTILREISSVPI